MDTDPTAAAPGADAPYRDATRPVEERLNDLVGRMTLDEKLAQLGCVWSSRLVEDDAFSQTRARALLRHGTGHVTRIGGASGLRPRESAAFMNAIQRFLLEETRLGIPAVVHEEGCAGLSARDATQFPQAIGLASTWEPALAEAMGAVIREQMRAVGARHVLAPVLDVARDPRWGRTEETFGEDPYLVSRMGVAAVRGLQGPSLAEGVVATGKHFLAYGAGEGGLNHAPAHVGPRELREVYARPFEACIREASLASVMNSYGEVDGLPCTGARAILEELLRDELGFDGVVVADYFAVLQLVLHHAVAADKGEAAERALEAGIDVELPALDCYGAPLRERVESGAVPVAWVDRSLRRLLRTKLALGLFERPFVDEAAAERVYARSEPVELARTIAARSLVLLRNEGDLLPLSPDLRALAVVGPCADDPRLLLGDYHYPAHQEIVYKGVAGGAESIAPAPDATGFAPGPFYRPIATPLAGVRAAVSARTEVRTARGCDVTGGDTGGIAEAVAAARGADAAVVCVGGKSGLVPDCTSGEFRDASHLGLTGPQQALVEAVVETGTPTVVVLVNGRPLALPWIAEHAPAVLEAWLPGEQGGHALADVLFGRVSPAGRLPVTLPRSVGQVPSYAGHKSGGGKSMMLGDYSDGPVAPLFPFGHGLAYTRFEYAALEIAPARPEPSERVRIACRVTNAGARSADEVVQLYLRDVVARLSRPARQLAGFARVPLAPGETRRVAFELDVSQLAFHDERMQLVVEPGEVRVMVGASSRDVRLEGSFTIGGTLRTLRGDEIAPTLVRVD